MAMYLVEERERRIDLGKKNLKATVSMHPYQQPQMWRELQQKAVGRGAPLVPG
jgi:hypothetical protein